MPATAFWPNPRVMRIVAVAALAVFVGLLVGHLRGALATGLTADGTYVFGDDFINFWSAPRLAWLGRSDEIYDFARFHAFEESVLGGKMTLYHYSYPPVMFLLSLPMAVLPYLPGLAFWFFGGIVVFALTVRVAWPGARWVDVVLYAVAAPAVFLNSMAGQNGTWMAAILGFGLMLLPARPILAGALLGVLVVKPQLAFLLPFALLAGRRWAALFATAGSAALLLAGSVMIFGLDRWVEYRHQVAVLGPRVLEDGTDFWYLFTSVFVTVRHLPASVSTAYVVQAVAGVLALGAVVYAWRGVGPLSAKYAALVMGTFFATPYIQVYDLVVAMLVPLWLLQAGVSPRAWITASVPLILAPLVVPMVAYGVGLEIGPLLLLPALVVSVMASATGDVPQSRQTAQPA